ncbi:hypothetical protein niasHT_010468 [Heterodera trifolii]|uniref:BACK domain-containing protein n=1 Tax=Heterodera trifolii TaxID=157864 RepID=A0ABD2MAS2_9BILA
MILPFQQHSWTREPEKPGGNGVPNPGHSSDQLREGYPDPVERWDSPSSENLSKKYMVTDLIFHCSRIPIKNLPNVILTFVQARLLELEFFAQRCLRYICQNAGLLLGTDDFLQIDQNCLCEIFDRDQLLISNKFKIWEYELMDPSIGFYNEDEDKVMLAIDFSVEENSEEQ